MIKEYNLSGAYVFALDPEKKGIEKEYFNGLLPDTILLPGTTAQSAKGKLNDARETGYLTERYPFTGWAWFSKKVTIDPADVGRVIRLYLERTRMTKVWVDDICVGSCDSLCGPHIYDLTKAITKPEFRLTVLVSNTDYKTRGGHMTSPDTQTNWIGITGRMALEVCDNVYVKKAFVEGTVHPKQARIRLTLHNATDTEQYCELTAYARAYDMAKKMNPKLMELKSPFEADGYTLGNVNFEKLKFPMEVKPGENVVEFSYPMWFAAEWNEYSPAFYEMVMEMRVGEVIRPKNDAEDKRPVEGCVVPFGLREIKTEGIDLKVNDRKVFLRGKHDGLLFPATGAAPTDISSWLVVMKTAKEYGINHYRFHTCCPPEAAFYAADLLGIYMCPELPFWGTLAAPGEEGYNKEEQDFLLAEGLRMQEYFGNHPSFTMLSLGNELWGSAECMGEMIRRLREADDRHLFTQGSNNFQHMPKILPEDDYFCGVRFSRDRLIRGSYGMCDAPLGHVQVAEPSTMHDYDAMILPEVKESETDASGTEKYIEIQYGTGVKRVKAETSGELIPDKPVISHEIGQYETYPDFDEIGKFKGVLAARNFEVFRERLEQAGMLPLAKDFFKNSGALAVQCYKEELEAAHRSRYMSGYQILDLQDFTGQGTALVGILDAFMESKGLITPEAWRGFCSDCVPLARFEKYVWQEREEFTADLQLSFWDYKSGILDGGLRCTLTDEYGTEFYSEFFPVKNGETGLLSVGKVHFTLPETDVPKVLKLTISLDIARSADSHRENTYRITVYPRHEELRGITPEDIYKTYGVRIASSVEEAIEQKACGEKVLCIPNTQEESIPGTYAVDFWCYPMFRDICESMGKPVAVGTMGLLIQKEDSYVSGLAAENYTTPDWYRLIEHADLTVLDNILPKNEFPKVQMIDNFERNHKLGLLYTLQTQQGEITVLTSRIFEITDYVEVRSFLHGLLTELR